MQKIKTEKADWKECTWHCPNCGSDSSGWKNTAGVIKAECKRCHAVMIRKAMGRRHARYDVYLP